MGNSTTSGSYNTVIGSESGAMNTGSNNTIIGYHAGLNSNFSGSVCIGYEAGNGSISSNKLYIENSNSAAPLIYGDFAEDKVTINDVLKLAPRSSVPSSPAEGEIYVNSSDHHIYCYLNSSWKQLDN
jgi:hypothetical protein